VSVKKKKPSAADVLRQEMQQPLVLPPKEASAPPQPTSSQPPPPTPPKATNNMSQSNDAASNEAKLKQQIEDLQSKLEAKTAAEKELETKTNKLKKDLDDAKKIALELSAPSKSAAKSTAITKVNTTKVNSALTARPTETREETARRRANTDIGWLD
jgi:membrane-associated HD superfamily phosphohydrolase